MPVSLPWPALADDAGRGRKRLTKSSITKLGWRGWYRAQEIIRIAGEFFEDQWFDRTRRVRTSGNASLLASGIAAEEHRDSEWYMPARPRHIRQALRAMPVRDVSGFTYIDLGCGKGRSLFVAAEFGFRRIVGVELSPILHDQACRNIRGFRRGARGCAPTEAVHQNAADFRFPEGNLVLYMFNPFGAETMQRVLDSLDAARRRGPCHVIVILLWPRCGGQVAALEGMYPRYASRRYQIFEARPLKTSEFVSPTRKLG